MQFKAYQSYKASGVEWLGDVPSHWEMKPIWGLFERVKRTNYPNEILLSVYRDLGVIPKDSRDDNHNVASEDLSGYQLLQPNELVINKMKAWQGSIAISNYKGIVSPAYFVYQPKTELCSEYMHYLLRSAYYIQSYKNFSKGIRVGQWDLDPYSFEHIQVLLPPLPEQIQITEFLEKQTARIDNLINKQTALIALLEQQRQSLLAHFVTKGLNPHAPMKPSGVAWLGDVPKHWERRKFKYILTEKKAVQNMELPFGAISFGEVIYKEEKANLTDELKRNYQEVRKGEFLINPLNLNYDLKSLRTALSTIDVVVSSGYIVAELQDEQCSKSFLKYLLYLFDVLNMKSLGNGVRQTITFKDIGNSEVYLPPLEEQRQIAEKIQAEHARIDDLICKQQALIAQLKTYRTSLISYAVTGKIDVREQA